jgi:hypothetical protein
LRFVVDLAWSDSCSIEERRRIVKRRSILAFCFALCAGGITAEASAQDRADRSFDVPHVSRATDIDRSSFRSVLLPPDVIARRGESPREALARALRGNGSAATDRRRSPERAK